MNGVQHNYPNTKKDESLRNFHWCLIRTLHNYPFSTDWKSVSVFLSMYKQEINARSWFLFPDIFKVFPMIFHRWYDMRSIRKNARPLCWLSMAGRPYPGQGLENHTTPHSNLVFPLYTAYHINIFKSMWDYQRNIKKMKTICQGLSPVMSPLPRF